MGRKSRTKREKREDRIRDSLNATQTTPQSGAKRAERIAELEDDIQRMCDGNALFGSAPGCPEELRQSHLEDILAFESVESGKSLFLGLQENGVSLPKPELLDEAQSLEKVTEIVGALARVQVFLMGFEDQSAREIYATLWEHTLREGCYLENRPAGVVTVIDVFHTCSQSELSDFLEDLCRSGTVH
jgi:hypothetical protein